jgi:urease accessory protein
MKGNSMNKAPLSVLATIVMALSASSADAHTGVGSTMGFVNGLLHPVFGIDHILAMLMVGTFAVQLGGRSLFLVPATFVGSMAVGGMLGLPSISIGIAEFGIALSVLTLGLIIAFRLKPAMPVTMAAVVFFGICHGHAHGTEMPENASGLAYAAGFMLTTAVVHAVGAGVGLSIGSKGNGNLGDVIVRSLGAIAAVVGVGLVAATV